MDAGLLEDQSRSSSEAGAPESSGHNDGANQNKVRLECPWCGLMTMTRQNRHGWLEERILPLFGVYPWACRDCREPKYYRNRGSSRSKG